MCCFSCLRSWDFISPACTVRRVLWYVSSCGLFRCVRMQARAAAGAGLVNNIEVDGGEIRPAVTRSPLPTAVALATTGEIVWANDAFAEISGRGTAVSGVRMGEIAPTFETGWLIKGQTAFPGELGIGRRQYHVFGSLVQSGAGQLMMRILSTAPSLSVARRSGDYPSGYRGYRDRQLRGSGQEYH